MKIKCVITDDEPIARKGLRSYIEKINYLTLIHECENAIQLNNLLKGTDVDLLFLDIEMPLMSGLEFLSGIQHPPKVIITSAYEKYAIQGYEFNVSDYLLKPISFERFLKSANKVVQQIEKESIKIDKEYIFVKSNKIIKKIFLHDILFFESMENYVIIHTSHSKEVVYSTLKNITESLPANTYIPVHRSYLVNINHVQSIDGNQLIIHEHKIPVSRNLREIVFKRILDNKLI